MEQKEVTEFVRERYAKIAKKETSCCAPIGSSEATDMANEISQRIGYKPEELAAVPEGANLGIGCGNPVALASLTEGETVLDLGSGAGFDAFLAANKVGKTGSVIGVDMTPEMVAKARQNAEKGGYANVEFRLAQIERLPLDDNSVDVVLSNCVINLSQDKSKVFREAFRVLKPGGRLMISDIVLLKELPDFVKRSLEAYAGCLSGAMIKDDYLECIKAAGFEGIRIAGESHYPIKFLEQDPTLKSITEKLITIMPRQVKELASSILSIKVIGIKPN